MIPKRLCMAEYSVGRVGWLHFIHIHISDYALYQLSVIKIARIKAAG